MKKQKEPLYTPSPDILEKYADLMVNFALNLGKGIKKGDVVRLSAQESAKPLYVAIHNAIVKAGGHVLSHYAPDEENGDMRRNANMGKYFFENAQKHQLEFFPHHYLKGLIDQIDHSLFILSEADKHVLDGVDPKKIMARGKALKPFMDWRNKKQHEGKFSWSIAMYGTPAMAREVGLTQKQYWNEIIKACFLDYDDPIQRWKEVYAEIGSYQKKLNALSPRVDKLHVLGSDADLWITLGARRQWLAGRGFNMPSFEIFTSPDWRGTNGWISFNQPLYRYGSVVKGISLEFRDGHLVRSKATHNEKVLKEMIATPGADRIGEFSLTDKRHSRITKFMGETLYDENMGGKFGNTHIALGMAYRDTCTGDIAAMSEDEFINLGFNDSICC